MAGTGGGTTQVVTATPSTTEATTTSTTPEEVTTTEVTVPPDTTPPSIALDASLYDGIEVGVEPSSRQRPDRPRRAHGHRRRRSVTADDTGVWAVDVPLQLGPNVIEVTATDEAGNATGFAITIVYVVNAPAPPPPSKKPPKTIVTTTSTRQADDDDPRRLDHETGSPTTAITFDDDGEGRRRRPEDHDHHDAARRRRLPADVPTNPATTPAPTTTDGRPPPRRRPPPRPRRRPRRPRPPRRRPRPTRVPQRPDRPVGLASGVDDESRPQEAEQLAAADGERAQRGIDADRAEHLHLRRHADHRRVGGEQHEPRRPGAASSRSSISASRNDGARCTSGSSASVSLVAGGGRAG